MAAEGHSDTMASYMEEQMKQMRVIEPCGKKLYLLVFIDACWMFMEPKQWMWEPW